MKLRLNWIFRYFPSVRFEIYLHIFSSVHCIHTASQTITNEWEGEQPNSPRKRWSCRCHNLNHSKVICECIRVSALYYFERDRALARKRACMCMWWTWTHTWNPVCCSHIFIGIVTCVAVKPTRSNHANTEHGSSLPLAQVRFLFPWYCSALFSPLFFVIFRTTRINQCFVSISRV